jgi:hypothetical protein
LPISRFLLGAHSLDQCILGSTMGLFEGLTLHFLFRDHIIKHIINATKVKRSYL